MTALVEFATNTRVSSLATHVQIDAGITQMDSHSTVICWDWKTVYLNFIVKWRQQSIDKNQNKHISLLSKIQYFITTNIYN